MKLCSRTGITILILVVGRGLSHFSVVLKDLDVDCKRGQIKVSGAASPRRFLACKCQIHRSGTPQGENSMIDLL